MVWTEYKYCVGVIPHVGRCLGLLYSRGGLHKEVYNSLLRSICSGHGRTGGCVQWRVPTNWRPRVWGWGLGWGWGWGYDTVVGQLITVKLVLSRHFSDQHFHVDLEIRRPIRIGRYVYVTISATCMYISSFWRLHCSCLAFLPLTKSFSESAGIPHLYSKHVWERRWGVSTCR